MDLCSMAAPKAREMSMLTSQSPVCHISRNYHDFTKINCLFKDLPSEIDNFQGFQVLENDFLIFKISWVSRTRGHPEYRLSTLTQNPVLFVDYLLIWWRHCFSKRSSCSPSLPSRLYVAYRGPLFSRQPKIPWKNKRRNKNSHVLSWSIKERTNKLKNP